MRRQIIISMILAFLVHGLIFFSWIGLVIIDFYFFPPIQPLPDPDPEITVILKPLVKSPEPLIPPAPQLPDPPKPQAEPVKPPKVVKTTPKITPNPKVKPLPELKKKKRKQDRQYARTTIDQAGKPTDPTNLIGDRDTLAASELSPVEGADPDLPTQKGVNPLFEGQAETVTQSFKEGSLGMDKTGEETETPEEATVLKKNTPDINEAPKVETSTPDKEDAARQKNKHLKYGDLLPNSKKGEGKSNIQDKPKEKESPKERLGEGSNKLNLGVKIDQKPKKFGFRGYSKKNKIVGSIRRNGRSSLNVKNTALGRYQALISKAVELQWQKNCVKYSDHIVPGVISLRFYVDKRGKVSGVKIQDVVGGNFIERGFTQRSIRQAKLPKMSNSVIKELEGDPLELIYNFYF